MKVLVRVGSTVVEATVLLRYTSDKGTSWVSVQTLSGFAQVRASQIIQ